jgi:hypothetical protein
MDVVDQDALLFAVIYNKGCIGLFCYHPNVEFAGNPGVNIICHKYSQEQNCLNIPIYTYIYIMKKD